MGICHSNKNEEYKNNSIEEKDQTTRRSESLLSNKTIPEKYKRKVNIAPKKSMTQTSSSKKTKKKNIITIDKINKEKRAKTLNFSLSNDSNKNNSIEKDLEINTQLIVNCNNKNPKDEYKIIKKLGKGAFGTVWKVKNIQTNLFRAMKKIPKLRNNMNNINEIINEIEILKHLDHPNIVKIFEFFIEADGYYIITEYCHEGELFKLIKKKGFFTEKIAANIMYQIFQAIHYCHVSNNIIHRDLKPENIMIESIDYETGFYNIKIIDFGTAKIIGKEYDIKIKKFVKNSKNNKLNNHKKIKLNNNNNLNLIGTIEYISPEMINGNIINYKSCDIWSFGIIMYELFHGYTPFKGKNNLDTIENIKNGKFYINEKLPFEVKDLIKKLLCYDQKERLGILDIKDIMNHNFFKGINFDNLFNEKVPENFKKSISDSEFFENKMSFHEELYSTDDTENEIDNIIDNLNCEKNKFIPNFSFGKDYCVVKFEENILIKDYFFL